MHLFGDDAPGVKEPAIRGKMPVTMQDSEEKGHVDRLTSQRVDTSLIGILRRKEEKIKCRRAAGIAPHSELQRWADSSA